MPDAASQPTPAGPMLGCIADDVTGATDLAINLVQGGMRVVQVFGVPTAETLEHAAAADAVVVALKTRSVPARDAVDRSLAALRALQAFGAARCYFKYCSTFDSTAAGNIGPVAEALARALNAPQTVFCPAFPRAGRTVYRGHLFVFDRLLNASGMQNHPLTPMTDADLVAVLSAQTHNNVGLIDYDTLKQGVAATRNALARHAENQTPNLVTDACDDPHLQTLARAVTALPLVTGGSGLARQLPAAYRDAGLWSPSSAKPFIPDVRGGELVLSGSCSQATRAQLAWAQDHLPVVTLNVAALLADPDAEQRRVEIWLSQTPTDTPRVVASTANPDAVAALQSQHGADAVAAAIERFMGCVATRAVASLGVRRLLVAGGETSGAVAAALGVTAVRIGPEIAAGVTWVQTLGQTPALALAFKSGNFGGKDIFTTAWETLL